MSKLLFKAQQMLSSGAVTPDTFEDSGGILDLGTALPGPETQETEQADLLDPRKPLTREQRERLPGELAAKVMDHYIDHLNDDTMVNPIRDGIPQCRNHPYHPPLQIGCIHGCASRDENVVLPVVRDYTLGDVFNWAKALVAKAVQDGEVAKGWRRPTDLTKR